MKRILPFVLALAAAWTALGADTRGYVSTGLIAHWDGVENAGYLTHDAAATTWIDLVAGRKFSLKSVTVGADRLTFAGSASSYGDLSAADTTATFAKVGSGGTIEVVLRANNANNAVAVQSPTVALSRYGSRSIVFSGTSGQPMLEWCWDAVRTNTVSMYYKSSLVQSASVNATAVSLSGSKDYWSPSGSAAVIGTRQSRANNHFNGSIYAIRLYDRALTTDEIAANAALDDLRFRQGQSGKYGNVITVLSERSDVSGTVSPSYGFHAGHVVGKSYTYTASATAIDTARLFKYECVGWELKLADGTVTTNTASTAQTCTFTYSAAMDEATLTWRWGNRSVYGDKTIYVDAATGDDSYAGSDIGSSAHPYKTINVAHTATTNYLAQNAGLSALVSLAAGTYDVKGPIAIVTRERIQGAGMDATGLNLKTCTGGTDKNDFALKLVAADSLLGSLCVTGRTAGGCSHQIFVANGRVEYVRSSGHVGGYNGFGLALYLTGGEAQYCVLSNNLINDMYPNGVGAYVAGGELLDSEICYNQDGAGRAGKGQGLRISTGAARRCRIHHNNEACSQWLDGSLGGGVYLTGGTLENCLVYKNGIKGATAGGGVYNAGGTVRYCTIYGNRCTGDTTGASGYYQSAGTAIDNIIFGNSVAGAVVSAGTFVTNLLDAAVAGYSLNTVTDEPYFRDPANFDFTIAKRASLAVGNAQPIAAVTVDLVGYPRAAAPTIGAYEYDPSKETFEVTLQVPQSTGLAGTPVPVNAIITGTLGATIKIAWFVDGVRDESLNDLESVQLTNLAPGGHTLRVEVTKNGTETVSDEKADAVRILSDHVYVNATGSGVFPYASAATGTNDPVVALAALWQSDSHTSRLDVAEGTFALGQQLLVKYPVLVTGAGRDKSILTRKAGLTSRGLYLNNAAARVSGLSLSGFTDYGGALIDAGTIQDCRITNCTTTGYSTQGGGVYMNGGRLLDSEVVGCGAYCLGAKGGGVHLEKAALVSNCTIRACRCHCPGRGSEGQYGGGMFAFFGTVLNTAFLDGADSSGQAATGVGIVALWDSLHHSGHGTPPVFRNCLFARNTGTFSSGVYLAIGTFENCTLTANRGPSGTSGVAIQTSRLNQQVLGAPVVRNCVIWENGGESDDLGPDESDLQLLSAGGGGRLGQHGARPEAPEGRGPLPDLRGGKRLPEGTVPGLDGGLRGHHGPSADAPHPPRAARRHGLPRDHQRPRAHVLHRVRRTAFGGVKPC